MYFRTGLLIKLAVKALYMEEINKEHKRKSKKQTPELQELVSEASLEKNYRILGKVSGNCYTTESLK